MLSESILSQSFFARPTQIVAYELLGAILVRRNGHGILAGRIVETEAYLHDNDPASHAFRGRTPRNDAMFAAPAHLYIYKIYGIHYCVNITTEEEGRGAAVLLRAIEPLQGLDIMIQRRQTSVLHNLCSGPGKLAQAFGFTLQDNYKSIVQPTLHILPAPTTTTIDVGISPRIGITKATDKLLRFYIQNNLFVSKPHVRHTS
ncbi:MAG: DNA-3-methyladenine glycosylase [Bacteroidota bacterium]|nr:DNA-3-methyladenine glycosylase [Candidatus Kapabacteria bacterium]MDW8219570.1 DNA-3-methyladenine glycosylase [Bacteroidota bacterium]